MPFIGIFYYKGFRRVRKAVCTNGSFFARMAGGSARKWETPSAGTLEAVILRGHCFHIVQFSVTRPSTFSNSFKLFDTRVRPRERA